MWYTGGRNGKLLQYSFLKHPMNSMIRQKCMTLKDELPRLKLSNITTGEKWRNSTRRTEGVDQSRNDAQLWMCLVGKVKSNAVNNIA